MERRCRNGAAARLVLPLLFLTLIAGCTPARQAADADPGETVPTITADTGSVARKPIARVLVIRGAIAAVPNEDVKVSALVPGRVDALTVAEGDTVRQGQVIARIDTRTLQDQRRQAEASREQASAQLENARLNLTRNEQLFARGVAAGKEVEDARVALAQAQAALEQASAALNTIDLQFERADVRAPIGGQVVKRMVSVGEQVDGTAASPLVEIANLDRVELAASVPADQLSSISTGQVVAVVSGPYPDRTFTGSIIAIAPAVDPVTNTTLVRIRVANEQRLLKVGMFAEARVVLAEHDNALVVPLSALVRDDDGAAVYVVSGDTATRTAVDTGIEQNGFVELTKGVSDGQTILVSGVHGLGHSVKLASTK